MVMIDEAGIQAYVWGDTTQQSIDDGNTKTTNTNPSLQIGDRYKCHHIEYNKIKVHQIHSNPCEFINYFID